MELKVVQQVFTNIVSCDGEDTYYDKDNNEVEVDLSKFTSKEDGTEYDYYLPIPDENGICQPDLVKIAKKQNDENNNLKWESFVNQWNKLKVGYKTTDKTTFQVKFGSELGKSYEQNTLYNIDTDMPVTDNDNVYLCSKDSMILLNNEKNTMVVGSTTLLHEDWGSFITNEVQIEQVLIKARILKEVINTNVYGEMV